MASHYYIRHSSILVFNEHLKPHMTEADVLSMIAQSSGGCMGLSAAALTHMQACAGMPRAYGANGGGAPALSAASFGPAASPSCS